MPEREKSTFIEKLAQAALNQILSVINRTAERVAKRVLRLVGLVLAGVAVCVLGIAFIAIGTVKWFASLMPSWLAWLLVGIILLLLGVTVTLVSLVASRT